MAKIQKEMLVGYSSAQMFNLVEDIENYPTFLPLCKRTEVHSRTDHKTVASLYFEHLGVSTHVTTENEKNFPLTMTLRLLEGPFRQLEGIWTFKALAENACKVDFQITYEFSNKLFDKTISPIFGQLADFVVNTFSERAKKVYGEPLAQHAAHYSAVKSGVSSTS